MYVTNLGDLVLELFDASDTLLESLTLYADPNGPEEFAAGFIGIDLGANRVSSALFTTVDTPIGIGTIVYQTVPEPGTLGLIALAFGGLVATRRRKTA